LLTQGDSYCALSRSAEDLISRIILAHGVEAVLFALDKQGGDVEVRADAKVRTCVVRVALTALVLSCDTAGCEEWV
jgi:hypothetical protein